MLSIRAHYALYSTKRASSVELRVLFSIVSNWMRLRKSARFYHPTAKACSMCSCAYTLAIITGYTWFRKLFNNSTSYSERASISIWNSLGFFFFLQIASSGCNNVALNYLLFPTLKSFFINAQGTYIMILHMYLHTVSFPHFAQNQIRCTLKIYTSGFDFDS